MNGAQVCCAPTRMVLLGVSMGLGERKLSVCHGELYSEKTQSAWCLCTGYMLLCAILR